MVFTAERLSEAVGLDADQSAIWAPWLLACFEKYEVNNADRVAAFVAQAAAESGFKHLEENLNYTSPERLVAIFPKYFTEESAPSFVGRPQAIANRVYGGRMGNQPEGSGDGWRFRGRGLFQLTGRASYLACGTALGVNLLLDPDKLLTPQWAALSAGWFWDGRNLNVWADQGNFDKITQIINGGMNGAEQRRALFDKAKTIFV